MGKNYGVRSSRILSPYRPKNRSPARVRRSNRSNIGARVSPLNKISSLFSKLKNKRPSNNNSLSSTHPVITFSHGKSIPGPSKYARARILQALSSTQTNDSTTALQQNAAIAECNFAAYSLNTGLDMYRIASTDSQLSAAGDYKFVLDSSSLSLEIANMGNLACHLRVHEYIARRDVPSSMNDNVNWADTDANHNTYLVRAGFSDSTVSIASPSVNISSRIFENPTFCSFYRITRVKLVELNPGQVLKLNVLSKSPKNINALKVGTSIAAANPLYGLGGITKGVLIQCWGQPVDDATTDTNTSTGAVKLSIIQRRHYAYRAMPASSSRHYVTNTLQSVTGATGMSELSGAEVAAAFA